MCLWILFLQIMVFFSSCNSVKFHSELLNYIDIPCLDIHGKQKQQKRTSTYFEFCNAEKGILLCTDVAARGLDIPAVVCFLTSLYQQNGIKSWRSLFIVFVYGRMHLHHKLFFYQTLGCSEQCLDTTLEFSYLVGGFVLVSGLDYTV